MVRDLSRLKKVKTVGLKQRVIDTFKEYGGWWQVEGMAEWLNADVEEVRKVYAELEKEGLMDRKVGQGGKV